MAIDPQPQPTSSRRAPGCSASPSLRQMRSCFARLRAVEVGLIVGEAGARVRHRRPEHEPVEVVADVVVVGDGGGVAAHRVAPAVEPGLLRRRRQRPAEDAEPAGGAHRRRDSRCYRPEVLGRSVAQRLDELEDVAVGVEVTGDVRPRQAQLVGAPQQAAHGVGMVHAQRPRAVRGPEPAAVPELDSNRRRIAEQRVDDWRDDLGHPAGGPESGLLGGRYRSRHHEFSVGARCGPSTHKASTIC